MRPVSRHVALALLLLIPLLAACGKGADKQAAGGGGLPPAPVVVQPAKAEDVPIQFEYPAQLTGSREVEVRARVTGIVDARLYQEGSRVARGAVLFRIDPAPYAAAQGQADAAVAAAEARLKQAEREMARIKPLFEAKAASQQEHDAAEANLDGARAELKRAQAALRAANIDLGYTQVTAPIAGVVGRALKVEGALVTPQDGLLTTLAQTDPMHAHFTVAEADQLKRKQELAAGSLRLAPEGYRVQLKLADGSVYPETGKIDFIDYKADAHTGAYAMRAVIPNARHTLTPGQFGRVLLSGLVRPNAIAVPQRAVLDGPQGKFVYLAVPGQDGKGRIAVPAPVVVGEWAKLGQENAWIVRQGLKAGDPVIVEGTARIFFPGQPVMPVTPQAMARQAQGAPGAGKQ